jgi:Helix-turn-helix domain
MAKQKQSAEPVGGFKLKAACRYVGGISQISMRRQIEKGNIKPCRNLRHLLIPKAELDRWLEEGQYTGRRAQKMKGDNQVVSYRTRSRGK